MAISGKEVQSLYSRIIISHGEKENELSLYHVKRCKADDRGEIIAHREKEKILGYFTQRHKERTSSTSRKEVQSR
jgi:hypothetical protein